MTDFTPANSQNSTAVALGADVEQYEALIDCSSTLLTAAAHELFDIPKYRMHLSTYVEVLTAEGATATADLGITGGDVDILIDGVDLNATGLHWSGQETTAAVASLLGTGAGAVLAANTTYSLLANNECDTAVFRVVSFFADLSPARNDPA